MRLSLLAAGLLLAARAAFLGAQVVDTTRTDSLARDTTDYTALFLKSQQDARRLIPVPPRIGSGALLPFHTRVVFNRDSILWQNAETVSDLLTKVPGVFLLRGGWAGRPELPAYQAHGARSVEYVLDGVPYLPVGQDSLMVDPSILPLSFLERIEIEKLPGQLRVLLYTHRHDRSVPYSRIGISSGDLQIARYQGQLEKSSRTGINFSAAFDHFSVPAQQGVSGRYENTQGWLRLGYVPSTRFGAELEWFLSSPDREAIFAVTTATTGPKDTLSRPLHGSRNDIQGRIFVSRQRDGVGPRLDLLVSHTGWVDAIQKDSTPRLINGVEVDGELVAGDTVYDRASHQRGVSQAGAIFGYRLPAASLDGSIFYRSAWTPLEARARGGISPNRWFTAGIEAVYQKHDPGPRIVNGVEVDGVVPVDTVYDESRHSQWVTARAGVTLPLGFYVSGVWRRGSEVAIPAVRSDSAQQLDDRSLTGGVRWGFGDIEASYSSNAAYRPASYFQYAQLATIPPSGRTQWITVNARIAPRQWLVFDGWYSTPQGTRPEGQPPTHSILNATIQSKFLPTFRSGIFNLKMQFTVENWGTGVLARDTADAPITLRGATQMRYYIGLQIGAFQAYYDRYNVAGARLPYVPDAIAGRPGLGPPRFASTFGVRWEFSN